MKAIRIHAPRDARYEEVPTPAIGSDDVLVRVRACGICGTDLEIFDGTAFYLRTGRQTLPMIPGHEWSGEVAERGANVREFAVGDRVIGECSVGCRACDHCRKGWYNQCRNLTETGILGRPGGFAQYIAFPRHFLHHCGELPFDEAATIEPTGIALYPPKLARVCPDDFVAVFGPGPIGLFAVQTARAYGARKVILVGTNEQRLAVGRKVGADVTVNLRNQNLLEEVRRATDGHMIDVVIEAVGKPAVWESIVSILATRARIAMTGLFAGEKCQVDFDPLVINGITILGSLGAPGMWDEAVSLHQRGLVTARPLITHHLPLSRFAEGIEIMRTRRDGAIKVILEP